MAAVQAQPDAFTQAFGSVLPDASVSSSLPAQSSAAVSAPVAANDAFTAAFGDVLKPSASEEVPVSPQSLAIPPNQSIGEDQPHPFAAISNYLADEPGKVYPQNPFLPLKYDPATKTTSLAIPEGIKSPIRGLIDLAESTGNAARGYAQPMQLSPDETNALMTVAGVRAAAPMVQAPSVVSRMVARVADQGSPKTIPATAESSLPNKLMSAPESAPASGLGVTQDATSVPVTSAPAQPNAPVAAPIAPVTAPITSQLPAVAPSITDKAPPKPFLPILTKGQAQSQADRIIAHFAEGGPTEADTSVRVLGSQPTLAQATGNSGLAALEKGYRAANPAFNNAIASQADAATEARSNALQQITGTPSDIETAMQAREGSTGQMRDQALQNAKPVDPKPVVDLIDSILASPSGQRDAVTTALTNIRAKLAQPVGNGTVERYQTDPAQLYGVRKAINDSLSPLASGTASDGRLAASELGQVKDALDDTIESGAPGFQNYVSEYAKQSQPINAMAYLQQQNLTDAFGNITLAKLDGAIKNIQKQQSQNGIRPASSISDDQLSGLVNIRDDLRRAGVKPSSRLPGTDTFQNLATNATMNALASGPVKTGLVALTGFTHGATLPLNALPYALSKIGTRGNRLVNEALQERLLNADQGANALISKKKGAR